ncbi:MAG: hypothetical protein GC154_21555 [bacterium]|nr:hypothetical protein [bacterium]
MQIIGQKTLPKEVSQAVIFIKKGKKPKADLGGLNTAIESAMEHGLFSGEEGEIIPLTADGRAVVLVGCGDKPGGWTMRKVGAALKKALQTKPLTPKRPALIVPWRDDETWALGCVYGASLGLYKWDRYLTPKEDAPLPRDWRLTVLSKRGAAIEREALICDGVNFARDLGNENADVADADFFEKTIRKLVGDDPRCRVEVLNEAELREQGMNLHLAVNQGSAKPPKLIIASYRGGKKKAPCTAFVGKGMTFDSGGLNLKPSGGIEDMRFDMCGAAAVAGALKNTLALGPACNALFVCVMAENAIGPRACKPGDVVRGYCGKTVEIGNTDAEGRLVLADANSYIAKNYKPESIINIATLTGAVLIALGLDHAGLMSTHDDLAESLMKSAETSDDRVWRLPMYEELRDHVKSDVADIKNIGLPKLAGTLAGAEFLRQFAQHDNEKQAWAHLDVAGTAMPNREVGYFSPGAAGAGVRLFTHFLLNRAKK